MILRTRGRRLSLRTVVDCRPSQQSSLKPLHHFASVTLILSWLRDAMDSSREDRSESVACVISSGTCDVEATVAAPQNASAPSRAEMDALESSCNLRSCGQHLLLASDNSDSPSALKRICLGLTDSASLPVDAPEKTLQALRVMQWNVLADGLAQTGDFCRVEEEYLVWDHRAPLLLDRILKDEPHIICLQELNHFGEYFLPKLKQHGYDGEFWQKPGYTSMLAVGICRIYEWSHSMHDIGNALIHRKMKYKFPMDGCAIFYKKSRLQHLESDIFRYVDSKGVKLNQGGQICRFKDLDANDNVVIVNTHLKAKEGDVNENLRVMQIRQLLQRLDTMTKGSSTGTILCGDLNADPYSQTYSIVHERFVSVYSLTCPCKAPHPTNEPEVLEFCDAVINGGAQGEPLFTTWKFRSKEGEKQRTIDYIWYRNQNKLVPYRRWNLPNQTTIGVNGLPCALYPSDHLPLTCEFRWKVSGAA